MDQTLKSPALQSQTDAYPAEWHGRVPRLILMTRGVLLVEFGKEFLFRRGKVYEAFVKSDGTLFAFGNYGTINLLPGPDCYQVIEFHRPNSAYMDIHQPTVRTPAKMIEVE